MKRNRTAAFFNILFWMILVSQFLLLRSQSPYPSLVRMTGLSAAKAPPYARLFYHSRNSRPWLR
jgi:hypothetical protein